MNIRLFEKEDRDDLIFMILQAKDALGRVPRLNEDLLDVEKNYFDKGGEFFVAIDESGRVIGSVGYLPMENSTEAFLHRLYVKAAEKRKGIGSKLLETAEAAMRIRGSTASNVHMGSPKEQWFESYAFYPKHGYKENRPGYMRKEL